MFGGFRCKIPMDADHKSDDMNNLFIGTIMEQERRVKDLRMQEIQMTAENPRIRAQQETTDIAIELKAQKTEDFLYKKRRQQLRQNNIELRQLEVQLKAADVSKQLAEQRRASDKQKEDQMKNKKLEDAEYEKYRLQCQKKFEEMENKRAKKKEEFRNGLLGQMTESNERRKQEYEQVLKDRAEMERILQRYKAEQDAEYQDLLRRRENALKEMDECKRMKMEFLAMQRAEKGDELKKFQQMMLEREEKNLQLKLERQKLYKNREALSERIGQQLYKVESEKMKRENLLLDLLVEERNTIEDIKYKQSLEKQSQDRVYMRMEFDRYRSEQERRKLDREKNVDAVYLAEMRRQLDERDKQDQLTEKKRRLKIKEYGRAIQDLIEQRRQERAINAAEELKRHETLLKEERHQTEMAEDERLQMLKKAPIEVLRYLPAGFLTDTERQVLGLCSKGNN